MKDMYDWLNTIPVDEGEMEEMETTEKEQKRVKEAVKKQVSFNENIKNNKKLVWQKRSAIAAAVVFITLGGGAAVGIANPAFAANIPIIGDIFRFFDIGDNFTHYQEYSEHLNLVAEDNGVTMKIEDAVFDGKNVFYTYSLNMDKDYGKQLGKQGTLRPIKDYEGGMGGSSIISQVDGTYYVGQDSYSINEERDAVDLDISIDKFTCYETGEEVEGNWNFSFRLNAVTDYKMPINISSKTEDADIKILSITNTPMSFLLDYSYVLPKGTDTTYVTVELKVEDNNGKVYETIGGTSFGDVGVSNNGSYIYGKLDESAKYITVTPVISVSEGGGGISIDEDGNETAIEFNITEETKALKDLKFEPIKIHISK